MDDILKILPYVALFAFSVWTGFVVRKDLKKLKEKIDKTLDKK